MISFFCIAHDNIIEVDREVGKYIPDWCDGKIYDLEGDTCVWQWELEGHLMTRFGKHERPKRRLIEAGSGKRPSNSP